VRLTVHRAKGSVDSTHPLSGHEPRELRALRRTQAPGCRFIFMNERGAPMTAAGFRKMLSTVGTACGLPHVHPDMLRHLPWARTERTGTDPWPRRTVAELPVRQLYDFSTAHGPARPCRVAQRNFTSGRSQNRA